MKKRLFKGVVGAVLGLLTGAFYGLFGTALLLGFLGILLFAIAALFNFWPAVDPNTLGELVLWTLKIGTIVGVLVGRWLGFAKGFDKPSEEKSYRDHMQPIWPFYLFRRHAKS